MLKRIIESFIKGHDIFDLISYMLIPIIIMILNIWLVNRNTNKQIKNQNVQTYKPRLRLSGVEYKDAEDCHDKYLYFGVSKFAKTKNEKSIKNIKILYDISNIGYGIAHRIKFYSLIEGEKCFRAQSITDNRNQKMASTDEIAKDEKIGFYFSIAISDDFNSENDENDFFIMICDYEDLNQNHYKLMIGLIVKKVYYDDMGNLRVNFGYYYYHEGTNEYNRMIKKHKKKYEFLQANIQKKDN